MAITEFSAALNQVATERGIPVDSVIESIKMALLTAYKKDRKEAGEDVEVEEFEAEVNPDTGEMKILKDGSDVTPSGFGRIAAQTAKQVIIQRLREAERDSLFNEFKGKEADLIPGIIQRWEGRLVLVDLGHVTALMPLEEQIDKEKYTPGARLKFYVKEVTMTTKGPQVIVSRAHPEILRKLFTFEIPEVSNGVVEIKGIAREAGSRSKVAVYTKDENIDPGRCDPQNPQNHPPAPAKKGLLFSALTFPFHPLGKIGGDQNRQRHRKR